MATSTENVNLDDELDALQRESNARRDELRAIAATLPELQSRRAILVTMARDFKANADLGHIARRAVRKLGRAPRAIWRRITSP